MLLDIKMMDVDFTVIYDFPYYGVNYFFYICDAFTSSVFGKNFFLKKNSHDTTIQNISLLQKNCTITGLDFTV